MFSQIRNRDLRDIPSSIPDNLAPTRTEDIHKDRCVRVVEANVVQFGYEESLGRISQASVVGYKVIPPLMWKYDEWMGVWRDFLIHADGLNIYRGVGYPRGMKCSVTNGRATILEARNGGREPITRTNISMTWGSGNSLVKGVRRLMLESALQYASKIKDEAPDKIICDKDKPIGFIFEDALTSPNRKWHFGLLESDLHEYRKLYSEYRLIG